MRRQQGFTIIEVLIATFIIGTVVVGLFGLFVLNLRLNQEAERRVVGTALANSRAEMIRNLPYDSVGTVGGIPAGSIPQEEVVNRNDVDYTVSTDIRYVDDPFDGIVTGQPPDTVNVDYKQARIEVTWNSQIAVMPLVMLLHIAPPGIEEGESAGTLVFQAIDAAGAGVSDAEVRLMNDTVNPTVDITTETDDGGTVVLPGLPEASDSYELSVTKPGFTSEQTYDGTPTFIPNPDHAHLSALPGEITPKTFSIDVVSQLNITTQDPTLAPLPAIAYALRGTKNIGTNNVGETVYVVDVNGQTNGTGKATHADLVWDSYDFAIDGVATGYDIKETSFILPLLINPSDTIDLIATLVEHRPISLHVTVTSAAGQSVDNATVRLFGNGYDHTLGTGIVGQVYFPAEGEDPLPVNGSYTLEVSASGFENFTDTVTVSDTTRQTVQLTPISG